MLQSYCFRLRNSHLIDQLIVGAVDRLNVHMMYRNDGELAFNSYIEFTLLRQYFQHYEVLPSSVSLYVTYMMCMYYILFRCL